MGKTIEGKPDGWVQFVLAIDCETTGINYRSDDPSEGHQAISWGMAVASAQTFNVVSEPLYLEVKWNDECLDAKEKDRSFGTEAEKIHGLTLEYLEENGMPEEEAVTHIGSLILDYWGTDNSVMLLGQNVATFDLWFLRRALRNHGIHIKTAHRVIDTATIGIVILDSYNSDQVFETCGYSKRGDHNSLDDALMSLGVCRKVKNLIS
jgi:DNA polymerase III epsilon subunit-like protein